MTNNDPRPFEHSPGIQLGVICLRHWLQCVDEGTVNVAIPYHESDRVVQWLDCSKGINDFVSAGVTLVQEC